MTEFWIGVLVGFGFGLLLLFLVLVAVFPPKGE